MQKRAIFTLTAGVVLAVITVVMARSWIDQQVNSVAAPAPEKAETATVVVSTVPLGFGNTVRKEHLREVEWPADMMPSGVFTGIEEIGLDEERRVALRAIEENEPVRHSAISGFGGRASLSSVISDDMRATTIRVNDVHGVAGFVLPGDRVDILLTRNLGMDTNSQQTPDKLATELLLQNVRVLGIDQDANEKRENPGVARAVTTEVSPEQAQKLVLAQQIGTLSLALRSITDARAQVPPMSISLRDLRIGEVNDAVEDEVAEEKPEPKPEPRRIVRQAPPPQPNDPKVRVFRGTTASSVEVPRDTGPGLFAAQTAESNNEGPRPLPNATSGQPVPLWSNPTAN